MRFATVAAVFAGAVSAKTVYSTDYITVTSCAPEVTNCPARSTQTYSSVYPVESSTYPVVETTSNSPATGKPSSLSGYPTGSAPSGYPHPSSGFPSSYVPSSAPYPTTIAKTTSENSAESTSPVKGSSSVLTISTTTCIPTVIYSTVTVTPTSASSVKPSASVGTSVPYGNSTSPATPSSTYPVTAGAASLGGSAVLAIAAAAIALL